jgi:hypothetical protein
LHTWLVLENKKKEESGIHRLQITNAAKWPLWSWATADQNYIIK